MTERFASSETSYIHSLEANEGIVDGDVVPSSDLDPSLGVFVRPSTDDDLEARFGTGLTDDDTQPAGWTEDEHAAFLREESVRASEAIMKSAEEAEAFEVKFGPGYWDVIAVIDAGIEKSRKGGYAELKVSDSSGHEIPLGRYLAVDVFRAQSAGVLTLEGASAIVRKYINSAEISKAPTTPVAARSESVSPDAQSTSKGKYEDDRGRFDWQKAAAGDDS